MSSRLRANRRRRSPNLPEGAPIYRGRSAIRSRHGSLMSLPPGMGDLARLETRSSRLQQADDLISRENQRPARSCRPFFEWKRREHHCRDEAHRPRASKITSRTWRRSATTLARSPPWLSRGQLPRRIVRSNHGVRRSPTRAWPPLRIKGSQQFATFVGKRADDRADRLFHAPLTRPQVTAALRRGERTGFRSGPRRTVVCGGLPEPSQVEAGVILRPPALAHKVPWR